MTDGEIIDDYVITFKENDPIFDSEKAKKLLDDAHIERPMKEKAPTLTLAKIAAQVTTDETAPADVQPTLPEPAPQPVDPATIAAARAALPPSPEQSAAAALRDLVDNIDTLPGDTAAFPAAFIDAFESTTHTHATGSVRPVRNAARKALRQAAGTATASDFTTALHDGTLTNPAHLRRILTEAADNLTTAA